MPGWGPLEWFVVSQTFIPALLFIPGLTPIRVVTRVAAFAIGLVFWAMLALRGRESREMKGFPARPFMAAALGLLVLELAHPDSSAIAAAVGQVLLYAAVISPVFWAGSAVKVAGPVPAADGDPLRLQRRQRHGGRGPGLPAADLQPAGDPGPRHGDRQGGQHVRIRRRPDDRPAVRPERLARRRRRCPAPSPAWSA